MTTAHGIRVRRAYEAPRSDDGTRVLVDRLWPRGLSKRQAGLDAWSKDVAPSDELRRWYGHRPERFEEFGHRYRAELGDSEHAAGVDRLRDLARTGRLTLLTATKDVEHSHVPTLLRWLESDDA